MGCLDRVCPCADSDWDWQSWLMWAILGLPPLVNKSIPSIIFRRKIQKPNFSPVSISPNTKQTLNSSFHCRFKLQITLFFPRINMLVSETDIVINGEEGGRAGISDTPNLKMSLGAPCQFKKAVWFCFGGSARYPLHLQHRNFKCQMLVLLG